MAPTPELKREYLDMIPEFRGDNKLLPRFIEICEKLVKKFYNKDEVGDFQNEYLMSSILAKVKGEAAVNIASCPNTCWSEVKAALLNTYSDKRDCYTLNIEMSEMKQNFNESPFEFYNRLQELLNLQVSYFTTHIHPDEAKVLICYSRHYALRILLRGLKEPLGTLMRTKNPTDMNNALSMLTNDFQLESVVRYQTKFNSNNIKPKQTPNTNTNKQLHQPAQYQQKPTQQLIYRPNPQYTNNYTRMTNNTNAFRPDPNKKFPKPTPMSINTRQSFIPKSGPSQYRPQQSYPVQHRPNIISEELFTTEIDQIPTETDEIDEQIYNDENTEYYFTKIDPNTDD